MKRLLPLFLLLVLSGCITKSHIAQTSGVSPNDLNLIPKNSKEVIIKKEIAPAKLYEEIFSSLLNRGHRISKDDKERFYIVTEGKDIGLSTLHRATIHITSNDGISMATIRTEWKPGTDASMRASMIMGVGFSAEWEQAVWVTDSSGLAFAESVAVAKEVVDCEIEFK